VLEEALDALYGSELERAQLIEALVETIASKKEQPFTDGGQ